MAGERIVLKGLTNTRDLGGYRTADGGVLRPRKILRSGALGTATAEDLAVLKEQYDMRTVVDFRTKTECAEKPDPQLEGVSYISNPILEEAQMGITHENEQRPASLVDAMIAMTREIGEGARRYLADLYPILVTHEQSIAGYRRFFDILLAQEEGAVLYHCSEGKDRVGTATALFLSALGVGRDTIMADYLLTNLYSGEKRQSILHMIQEKVPGDTLLQERFLILNSVDESYLEAMFAAIEETHGTLEGFLERQMGLSPERLARLKQLYVAY